MTVPKRDTLRRTYADYLAWSRSSGDELIDGVAYVKEPPAPSPIHQGIVSELCRQAGDTAHDNLGNSVLTTEFVCHGCLNSMYDKLTAYDSKQAYGLLLDSQTSYSHVGTIIMPLNEVPLLDMGYQDVYSL
jgi:hypothetical protein